MLSKAEETRLLNNLAALGGKAFKDEDIEFTGTKLVLPETFKGNLKKAITFLQAKMEEEESIAVFTRDFPFRPADGAYCAFKTMKNVFGLVQGKKIPGGFFTPEQKPQYIQVEVGPGVTEEVPWGRFQIPLLANTDIYFGDMFHLERGQVFHITIQTPRKNRFVVEGLFQAIAKDMSANSIYRGKAIDGQTQPNFIDLTGTDPDRVIYSDQVRAELEANVWGFMSHTEEFLKLGMSPKRSVLLEGPYGTGKTMTARVTALKATEQGWTFIMARPGRDDFFEVMQTAKLYQPAVVFMEDADTLAHEDDNDNISKLLDVFDGIQSKGTRLMVVLTTNHPEKLTTGMRRPGRIDQIINIGMLDRKGVEALFRTTLGPTLDESTDFDEVYKSCSDYFPAFLKETADRSIRYAVVRNGGSSSGLKITTQDLIYAANSLRSQFDWMTTDVAQQNTDHVGRAIAKAAGLGIAHLAAPTPEAHESIWDRAALAEIRKEASNI